MSNQQNNQKINLLTLANPITEDDALRASQWLCQKLNLSPLAFAIHTTTRGEACIVPLISGIDLPHCAVLLNKHFWPCYDPKEW